MSRKPQLYLLSIKKIIKFWKVDNYSLWSLQIAVPLQL